ncbi:MAG: pitrilysin family protein [Nannocystaceae bacterium]
MTLTTLSRAIGTLCVGLCVTACAAPGGGATPQPPPSGPQATESEGLHHIDVADEEETESERKAKTAAAKRAMLEGLPPLPGIESPNPVVFPTPVLTTFDNGLELIILEDHEVPTVRLSLHIKAGNIYAPADRPTLAQLVASLLTEGTQKTTKAKLDAKIDATGGAMSSGCGDELATLTSSMLSADTALALRLMAEQAMLPAFEASALEKLKDNSVQSMLAAKGSPSALAARLSRRVIYGNGSAYGRGFPSDAQIERVTPAEVEAFYASHYVPNNAILVMAGDLDSNRARRVAKRYFGRWKRGETVTMPHASPPTAALEPTVHIIPRPASVQANIYLALPAPRIGEPGWLETELITQVLSGGTLTSRLNLVLREQLGLTYGARASHDDAYDGGQFRAGGSTKNETADRFVSALLGLVFGLSEAPLSEPELRRTKDLVSGRFALEAEGVDIVMGKTIQQHLYGLPDEFWTRYRSDIETLSPTQVFEAAKQVLDRGRLQIVAVGKRKQLEAQLAKYGQLRFYDNDLNPIP